MGCFCIGRPNTADSPRPAKRGLPELEALKQKQALGPPDGGEVLIRAALQHSAGAEGSKSAEASLLPSTLDAVEQQPNGGGSEGLEQEGSASSAAPLLAEAARPAGDFEAAGSAGSSVVLEESGPGASDMDEQADDQVQLLETKRVQTTASGALSGGGKGSEQSAAAGSTGNRSSQQEQQISPTDEGSQTVLLPADSPSHFSLKEPRFSRLSSLLSACTSRTGEDSGEQHSKQQPQQQQQVDMQQQQQQHEVCSWMCMAELLSCLHCLCLGKCSASDEPKAFVDRTCCHQQRMPVSLLRVGLATCAHI